MNEKKLHILSLLAALMSAVIFGMSFMFSKLALAVARPTVLLAFRFTVAVAAMTLVILLNALVGRVRGRKLFAFSLRGKPVYKLLLLGMVQPVAYFIFENYGYRHAGNRSGKTCRSEASPGGSFLTLRSLSEVFVSLQSRLSRIRRRGFCADDFSERSDREFTLLLPDFVLFDHLIDFCQKCFYLFQRIRILPVDLYGAAHQVETLDYPRVRHSRVVRENVIQFAQEKFRFGRLRNLVDLFLRELYRAFFQKAFFSR